MENADSRLDAVREWVSDEIRSLVLRINDALRRVGADVSEAFERLQWLENEVKAHRRLMEVNAHGKT